MKEIEFRHVQNISYIHIVKVYSETRWIDNFLFIDECKFEYLKIVLNSVLQRDGKNVYLSKNIFYCDTIFLLKLRNSN